MASPQLNQYSVVCTVKSYLGQSHFCISNFIILTTFHIQTKGQVGMGKHV